LPDPPGEDLLEDARGLLCPIPVIRLARRIETAPLGSTVLLLADDPAAPEDVGLWCRGHRQELVSSTLEGSVFRIRVRRTR
jgi:tRNA 2-thiouridine synthesizing protein A